MTTRRRMATAGLAGLALLACAAGARADGDPQRAYRRQFDQLRDVLAGREARARLDAELPPPEPWTGPDAPVTRGSARDVPEGGGVALVARVTAGSPLTPGDRCRMEAGGGVVALGDAREMGALVRYAAPPGPAAAGACPGGTLALVAGSDMYGWPAPGAVGAARRRAGELASRAADAVLGPEGAVGATAGPAGAPR